MGTKKWIKQTEINIILRAYSVHKNEFEEVAQYSYLHQLLKGYMITISEEFQGNDKTGRILVYHTEENGKRTFCDIWERDLEGKLYFKFRNPANVPLADTYYIWQLEKELEQLREVVRELQNQKPKHNERNAGRKKADEKWTKSYLEWVDLYEAQKSIKEILEIMGISRSTHFRYKKEYQTDSEIR